VSERTVDTPAAAPTGGPDFLDRAFGLVDDMDLDGYVDLYADDGRFTFGNAPTAVGPTEVRAGLAGFYATIAGMRHEFVAKWWPEPDVGITEARVTYTRLDRSSVTLPVVTIYRLRAGKAADVRVYMDVNPLSAS
jgi:limonene-1,2-epoxide hydrolase